MKTTTDARLGREVTLIFLPGLSLALSFTNTLQLDVVVQGRHCLDPTTISNYGATHQPLKIIYDTHHIKPARRHHLSDVPLHARALARAHSIREAPVGTGLLEWDARCLHPSMSTKSRCTNVQYRAIARPRSACKQPLASHCSAGFLHLDRGSLDAVMSRSRFLHGVRLASRSSLCARSTREDQPPGRRSQLFVALSI